MNDKISRLPYHFYFVPTLLFCLAGILVTGYLTQSHYYNYTDSTYSSFCSISRAINCDTVAQSPWSILWGLPVAIWGLFGYLLFLFLLIPLRRKITTLLPIWNILFFIALGFSCTSVFFAYISATKIHSYCILCIANYSISFALLFYTWLIRRRFGIKLLSNNTIKLRDYFFSLNFTILPLFVLLAAFTFVITFIPAYWELDTSKIPPDITRGTTTDGHPWIGAEHPILTIEEYSDYQCFQCYKMQYTLRQLVKEHPEKIRLVHRHYPMDHEFNPIVVPTPFHVGSGKMSLLAIYATSKGKFWEMNDALFELGRSKKPFNTKSLAKQTNIPASELTLALSHPDIRKVLNYDILSGMKKRITATPSFIINDEVYVGFIPPEILEEAIRPK